MVVPEVVIQGNANGELSGDATVHRYEQPSVTGLQRRLGQLFFGEGTDKPVTNGMRGDLSRLATERQGEKEAREVKAIIRTSIGTWDI